MIEITPVAALMFYLCLTLFVLFTIWGYHHFRTRKKKVIIVEKKLYLCEYCSYNYLYPVGNEVTKCPQCGSFNKMGS